METFVNLHSHTSASFLDAIITIPQLFSRVKELEQSCIAITDHGVMSNIYQAYKEYKKYKAAGTPIKFIPGNEIYFVEDLADPKSKRRHLVLLASNEVGYKNLLRITAAGFKNSVTVMGREFPRVDAAILQKYNEGLFSTSACGGSLLAAGIFGNDHERAKSAALLFKGIFGDRFFIELQPHSLQRDVFNQNQLNDELKKLAEELGIEMVAVCDSHYLTKKHEKYHDMILSIGYKKSLDDPTRHRYASFEPCLVCKGSKVFPELSTEKCYACYGNGGDIKQCAEFYLKSEREIYDFFAKRYDGQFAQRLIDTTAKIANSCEWPDYMEPKGHRLPTFPWEAEPDADSFLKWLAKSNEFIKSLNKDHAYLRFKVQSAFKAYTKDMDKSTKKVYWDRIITELETFESQGFCSYMLIVGNYINWAKVNNIGIGAGRGSGGGSLVAFLLKIHIADPIKYKLVFERFHNKLKTSLPDVDSDISPQGRERLIQYVEQKYGKGHVAYISNILKLTPKLIVKDLARSLNLGGDKSAAFKIANDITSDIPDTVKEGDKTIKIDNMGKALKYSAKLRNLVNQYPEVLDYANNLVGLPRSFATHAAGIIIADVPLDEYVPLRSDNDKKMVIQYDKELCEELGLVKMDFLGLETLDVLQETYVGAKKLKMALPSPEELVNMDGDEATYKLIQSGMVTGVFQLAGSMAPLCKTMKPKSIPDIALISAMGRPGCPPADRLELINRKFGKSSIVYRHPILEPILNYTYGVFVYDEDLLKMAKAIAGWDLAKADSLRKLTKLKEKGADLAIKLEVDFVNDAAAYGKVSRETAKDLWDNVIVKCASYNFCLAHAIQYSMISYQTAYYKTHAPAAYLCALLNSETRGAKADRGESIDFIKKDLKAFKIKIDSCDINLSKQYYTLKDKKTILTGLGAIKGLGDKALDAIIAHQPYKSFEDFLYRTPSSCVNKSTVIALAKAGAFDSFGISRKYASEQYAGLRQEMLKISKRKDFLSLVSERTLLNLDNYEQEPDLSDEIYIRLSPHSDELRKSEWDIKQLLLFEKEVLGEYVSGSVELLFPGFFKDGVYGQPFSKIVNLPNNASFPTEGIISAIKELPMKSGPSKGKIRGVISINNLRGESMEINVWPDIYAGIKANIKEGIPLRGQFKVNDYNGVKSLNLVKLEALYCERGVE